MTWILAKTEYIDDIKFILGNAVPIISSDVMLDDGSNIGGFAFPEEDNGINCREVFCNALFAASIPWTLRESRDVTIKVLIFDYRRFHTELINMGLISIEIPVSEEPVDPNPEDDDLAIDLAPETTTIDSTFRVSSTEGDGIFSLSGQPVSADNLLRSPFNINVASSSTPEPNPFSFHRIEDETHYGCVGDNGEVEVYVDYHNMEGKNGVKRVVTEFAAQYHVNIEVLNAHGYNEWLKYKKRHANSLLIVFSSNLNGCDGWGDNHIDSVNGIETVSCQNDAVEASDKGTPIYDINKAQIAEFDDNLLCIFYDLPHASSNIVEKQLTYILDQYFLLKTGEAKILTDYDKISHIISTKIKRNINYQLNKLTEFDSYIHSKEESIRETYKKIGDVKILLENLNSKIITSENIESQISKIKELPETQEIQYDHTHKRFLVKTNQIPFNYKDMDFVGNSYNILINLNDNIIKITGNNNVPPGYIHPHIKHDGNPCWGNIGSGLYDMLDSGELFVVVSTIYDYLKTANEGDFYYNPLIWPKVKA